MPKVKESRSPVAQVVKSVLAFVWAVVSGTIHVVAKVLGLFCVAVGLIVATVFVTGIVVLLLSLVLGRPIAAGIALFFGIFVLRLLFVTPTYKV